MKQPNTNISRAARKARKAHSRRARKDDTPMLVTQDALTKAAKNKMERIKRIANYDNKIRTKCHMA